MTVGLEPADVSAALTVRILDSAGKRLWEGTSVGNGKWEMPFELKEAAAWSPANPALYACEVEIRANKVLLDKRSVSFGVRRLETRGSQILLNGERLFLKGMCYLFDHPVCGMTFDPAIVAADLDDLCAMGVACAVIFRPPRSSWMSATGAA